MAQFHAAPGWFCRDLRAHWRTAPHPALKPGHRAYCAFVFDRAILNKLSAKAERWVKFIWHSVVEMKNAKRFPSWCGAQY